jgi:uridine kinase
MREELRRQLAEAIAAIRRPHPVRVAIDGVDAAGKTSLAGELVEPLRQRGRPVIRASMDGFHNPRAVRYRQGRLSPDGYYQDSFDLSALRSLLLEPLGPAGSRHYRPAAFDVAADRPIAGDALEAPAGAVLLFDGIFAQRPELADCWELVIFVDVAFEAALERARERDAALFGSAGEVERLYRSRYIPAQRRYLAECRPKERADVVVGNDNPIGPTIRWRS